MKKLIFLLFLPLILFSCNGRYEHETIPNVDLRFTIYPNSVTYAELNHYGGYQYFAEVLTMFQSLMFTEGPKVPSV